MKTAIRRWSEMNPWIDFTVICYKEEKATTLDAIEEAYDLYWDEEYECYGDALEDRLNERVGDGWYTVTYIDDFDDFDGESDSEEYYKWLDSLDIPVDAGEWFGKEN